jgi:serine acetyltransferase
LAESDGIEMINSTTLAPVVSICLGSDDYIGKKLTNLIISTTHISEKFGKATLRKHVIIGSGSIVLLDITIKNRFSVGALSLVNKDLED